MRNILPIWVKNEVLFYTEIKHLRKTLKNGQYSEILIWDWLHDMSSITWFFKKWANPGLFFDYFQSFFKKTQFLQHINVKNVHPVYGARIRTHDLSNMSRRHPKLLDQGLILHCLISNHDCVFRRSLCTTRKASRQWGVTGSHQLSR